MPISKKFFHDKLILSLLSVNIFLAAICVLIVLLRFGAGGASNDYIVQFRANLGISSFKTGSLGSILSFALFAILVTAINATLSFRVYPIRRQLSLAILSLGGMIMVLTLIVSNAILGLR